MGMLRLGMLYLTTVLGTVIGTQGSGQGSVITENGTTYCLRESLPNYGTRRVYEDMLDSLLTCVPNHSGVKAAVDSKNAEDYKAYFRHACSTLPAIRNCLTIEEARWERCHNSTVHKMFLISSDAMEDLLTDGCVDEGVKLANVAYRLVALVQDHIPPRDNSDPRVIMGKCIQQPAMRVNSAWESRADIASKLRYLHTELPVLKDCYLQSFRGGGDIDTVTEDYLQGVIEKVKCIHPRNGSLVLCRDIGDDLVDHEALCPMKQVNPQPIGSLLEREASTVLRYDSSANVTQEQMQRAIEFFCQDEESLMSHLFEMDSWSRICLPESEYRIVSLIVDYYKGVLKGGCADQGRRIASVYANAGAALSDCYQEARADGDQDYTDPALLMRYYRELGTIKDCVVSRIGAEGRVVEDNLEALLNHIRRDMKCFSPQYGKIVLCHTIDD